MVAVRMVGKRRSVMSTPGDAPRRDGGVPPVQERFRLLLEDAPVAYHEIDREGRICRVNRAECAMLGYDRSELTGKSMWDLFPPEDRSRMERLIKRKLAGLEQLAPFQARLVRRSGS